MGWRGVRGEGLGRDSEASGEASGVQRMDWGKLVADGMLAWSNRGRHARRARRCMTALHT
eukprot:7618972-Pyramimonas_sp.AAC.1